VDVKRRIETLDFSDAVVVLKAMGIAVQALIESKNGGDFNWI
jgi:hypothetical protein